MINEYLLKKLADAAFAKAVESLQSARSKSRASSETLQIALSHHLREVDNWSGEISFSDLKTAKNTVDAFVPLAPILFT